MKPRKQLNVTGANSKLWSIAHQVVRMDYWLLPVNQSYVTAYMMERLYDVWLLNNLAQGKSTSYDQK